MVLLSCQCSVDPDTKPPASRQAMHDYANLGGRIFAAHYHYYWLQNGPSDFQATASWTPNDFSDKTRFFSVDNSFPKGKAFSKWLELVDASVSPGTIEMGAVSNDVGEVNPQTSQRWIYSTVDAGPDAQAAEGGTLNGSRAKYFSFNTPLGLPSDLQCGRVVFTDLHIGGNSDGKLFPTGCTSNRYTPEAKALEFLLFDLASCIQKDQDPPVPPK
jgi:hypothetical protein